MSETATHSKESVERGGLTIVTDQQRSGTHSSSQIHEERGFARSLVGPDLNQQLSNFPLTTSTARHRGSAREPPPIRADFQRWLNRSEPSCAVLFAASEQIGQQDGASAFWFRLPVNGSGHTLSRRIPFPEQDEILCIAGRSSLLRIQGNLHASHPDSDRPFLHTHGTQMRSLQANCFSLGSRQRILRTAKPHTSSRLAMITPNSSMMSHSARALFDHAERHRKVLLDSEVPHILFTNS